MVPVTENSRIEIGDKTGDLLRYKVIKGEQYMKESVNIIDSEQSWPLSPGVWWIDESGKEYGLVFENSSLKQGSLRK